MLVKEIMKRPFVIEKDISLKEAAKMMKDNRIGCLILVSDDEISGIITEGDLTRNFGRQEKISKIMSENIVTVEADEEMDKAVGIMKKNKIKRLPILNKGKLVGIITSTDIIANFEELEDEFIFE